MMNLYILPLIAQIGVWGWVVIALAILLLFGGKKIPELMRGTGKGIKEFKKGLNEGLDEDLKEEKKD
jgi:sec-independent protein translocase protein TatA|tara:strand:- start:8010 stop:8210 length:201 start_codon:yes stop_codon:yes gene_type:complete